jgi:predicted outer membrane repeat protein
MFRLFRFLDCNRSSRKLRPKPPPKVRTVRPRLEILEDRTAPAVFTVTNLGDLGIGNDNSGDLRYCINQANQSTDPDNFISFDSNLQGTINLNAALPALNTNVMISGPGSGSPQVDVSDADGLAAGASIFTVNSGVTAQIFGIGIQDGSAAKGAGIFNKGNLTLTDDFISGNTASGNGGGVYNAVGGSLNLCSCTLLGNKATNGGNGGGIYSSGSVQDCGSTIEDNYAAQNGGGFYQNQIQIGGAAPTADFNQTQFLNNEAYLYGGGIYSGSGATLTIGGGAIQGNTVTNGSGGGLALVNGTTVAESAVLTSVNVSNNSALTGKGGGIYLYYNVTFTMHGGSLRGNTAAGNGGGLYNYATYTNTPSVILDMGVLVSGNKATNGGGLFLAATTSTQLNTVTIQGNQATGNGTGIYMVTKDTSSPAQLATNNLTDPDDPNGPYQGPGY